MGELLVGALQMPEPTRAEPVCAVSSWTPHVLRGADGAPLRLYHGTGAVFDSFDLAFSPRGFWFTDNPCIASVVATSPHARMVGGKFNVRMAFLKMRRPLRLRRIEAVGHAVDLLLESQGVFDGIIYTHAEMVDPEYGPFEQYVVFSPEQVLPPFEDLNARAETIVDGARAILGGRLPQEGPQGFAPQVGVH